MLTDKEQRAVNKAMRILENAFKINTNVFDDPKLVKNFLRLTLGSVPHEEFHVMFFNNRHALLASECMFRGTIDGAAIYTREIVKRALELNAAAVIVAHNHPSGITEPSQSDHKITTKIQESLSLVDIRLLDHVVVSATQSTSFSERGWL